MLISIEYPNRNRQCSNTHNVNDTIFGYVEYTLIVLTLCVVYNLYKCITQLCNKELNENICNPSFKPLFICMQCIHANKNIIQELTFLIIPFNNILMFITVTSRQTYIYTGITVFVSEWPTKCSTPYQCFEFHFSVKKYLLKFLIRYL